MEKYGLGHMADDGTVFWSWRSVWSERFESLKPVVIEQCASRYWSGPLQEIFL